MDIEPLVEASQTLTKLLDDSNFSPLAVIWMKNPETGVWKLWIVPPIRTQKEAFFLKISKILSSNRGLLPGLDISMLEYRSIADKTIELLGGMLNFKGIGNARFTNSSFNGFLVDDAIVIRLSL